MNPQDRKAICKECPHFRRGAVHVETWCDRFDDQPQAEKNCEGARHRRWLGRIAAEPASCREWMEAARCPIVAPPALFYHVACMGHWREVLGEQLRLFQDSGLAPQTFGLGSDEDIGEVRRQVEAAGGALIGWHHELTQYETPTLHAAWSWARQHLSKAAIYMHTKGVSHVPHEDVRPFWMDRARATLDRRLAGETIICRWPENLARLSHADVVGPTLLDDPYLHFDGNMWMARCDWLAELPDPWTHRSQGGDRNHVEPWITAWPRKFCRAVSMTEPSTPIDAVIDARKTVCGGCVYYQRAGRLAWCDAFDDNRTAIHNCPKGRHGRWAARLFDVHPPQCARWERPPGPCPVCSLPDPLATPSDDIAAHLAAFHALVAREFAPPDILAGDGIVTYGDARVWPMLVVQVKLLRRFNASIPVQVWHVGMLPGRELDGLATFVDANAFARNHPFYHDRWTIKSWALAHAGFARALFLDADAYCVRDPAELFAVLDGEPSGFAYWPDLPSFADRTNYQLLDPHLGGRPWAPPVQGGHFLIDCANPAGWKKLMLCRWYDQHADVWWRHQGGDDQGGWRLILTLLGFKNLGDANWDAIAFICRHAGRDWIIHRCQSKWWGHEAPPTRLSLPGEQEALEILHAHFPATRQGVETWEQKKHRVRDERRQLVRRLFPAK